VKYLYALIYCSSGIDCQNHQFLAKKRSLTFTGLKLMQHVAKGHFPALGLIVSNVFSGLLLAVVYVNNEPLKWMLSYAFVAIRVF